MIEPSVNDPDESGSDDEIWKFVSNVGKFAEIINDQDTNSLPMISFKLPDTNMYDIQSMSIWTT